jgi:plastocyanin
MRRKALAVVSSVLMLASIGAAAGAASAASAVSAAAAGPALSINLTTGRVLAGDRVRWQEGRGRLESEGLGPARAAAGLGEQATVS